MWTSGPRAGRRIRRPRIRAPSSRPRTPPGRGSRRRTDPRRPAASAAPLALTNRRTWTSRCRRPSRRRPGPRRRLLRLLLRPRRLLRRCSLRRPVHPRPVGEPARTGAPWWHPGARPPTAWDRPRASDNPTTPGPGRGLAACPTLVGRRPRPRSRPPEPGLPIGLRRRRPPPTGRRPPAIRCLGPPSRITGHLHRRVATPPDRAAPPAGRRRRPGQGGGGFPRWLAFRRRRRPTTPRGRHHHRTAHGPCRQLGCRWIPQATDGSRSARHRSVLPRPSRSAVPRQAAACPDPAPRSRSRLQRRGDSRGRQTAGVR